MRGPPLPPLGSPTLQAALALAAQGTTGLSFVGIDERTEALPFSELHRRAGRVASALAARGVVPGDRIALVLPTAPSFPVAFFGALLCGAVPVPLYPPVRLGRLPEYHLRTARLLDAVQASMLLTDERLGRMLGETVARARPKLGWANVDELLDGARGEQQHPGTPDELALVQLSSGSTADPKPVALTHANVLGNLAAIDAYLPAARAGERHAGVSWLPLYHDMGLIGCLLLAVYRPGPLTLLAPERFLSQPAQWLRTISRERATISVAPNFAYGLCLKRVRDDELEGVDLSSWQLALCGAEAISPEVLARFAARFAPWGFDARALTPVYGLSEATLAVTFGAIGGGVRTIGVEPSCLLLERRAAPGPRTIASVGAPVAGVEVELRDDAGARCEERRVGRIFVRGPGVSQGYLGAPSTLVDGFFDTGDLGFEEGGELFVCGREKEVVITRGRNHPPQEFEEALDGIDGLRTGCAVAVGYRPTGADGEELAILAELAPGHPSEARLMEQVRAAVTARTGVRPHTVRLLAPGTLPRTSSGKLRRGEARLQLEAETLAPPAAVTTVALAGAFVRSQLAFARARLRP